MVLLLIGVMIGIWLYRRSPRLEGATDSSAAVRAYVDGKRTEAYVKED